MSHTVKLFDFCRIIQGGRHKLSGKQFVADGFPAYGAGGLNGRLPTYEFDEPGVILSSIGARCGKCFYAEGKWSSLANTQVILPDPTKADARYLWYQLNDENRWPRSGTAQPFIKPSNVKEHQVFLPPLDDQRRIAAVLDRADALRFQRQKSLQLTEKLLHSVFIDMFVRNPEAANWTPRSVYWLAKEAKGSVRTGPFGSQLLHSEFVDNGIAVLGIDNAVKNRFEWGQPRFITPEKYQGLKRYKVYPGDLIITIMGTLGRCAIVPDDIPEAINTKHLCCITLDHKKCLPEFLHAAFLNHPDVLRQLGVRTKGAVMPGLNMGIIKGVELLMPPIELQENFKRIVALCETSRTDLEDSQDTTENLFGSIQQRAFRGELDLSRLKLAAHTVPDVALSEPATVHGRYKRPGYFIAPPEIEDQMLALEDKLDSGPGDSIPWNENYFKYRTLSQVLQPPFSFAQIWEAVKHDIEEADYEIVKETVFEYVREGILRQRFRSKSKEIVFFPNRK